MIGQIVASTLASIAGSVAVYEYQTARTKQEQEKAQLATLQKDYGMKNLGLTRGVPITYRQVVLPQAEGDLSFFFGEEGTAWPADAMIGVPFNADLVSQNTTSATLPVFIGYKTPAVGPSAGSAFYLNDSGDTYVDLSANMAFHLTVKGILIEVWAKDALKESVPVPGDIVTTEFITGYYDSVNYPDTPYVVTDVWEISTYVGEGPEEEKDWTDTLKTVALWGGVGLGALLVLQVVMKQIGKKEG